MIDSGDVYTCMYGNALRLCQRAKWPWTLPIYHIDLRLVTTDNVTYSEL